MGPSPSVAEFFFALFIFVCIILGATYKGRE